MIRLALGLVLLIATAASAEEIDCASLIAGQAPYALTFETETIQAGHPAIRGTSVNQIFRKEGETIAYIINGPSNFVRNRYIGLFVMGNYFSAGKITRTASYSIDPRLDYISKGEPLDFTMTITGDDGKVTAQMRSIVTFAGPVELDLGPCHVKLAKVLRSYDGTADGRPISYKIEIWYSPELRWTLYSRIEDSGRTVSYRATGITTAFTPVE